MQSSKPSGQSVNQNENIIWKLEDVQISGDVWLHRKRRRFHVKMSLKEIFKHERNGFSLYDHVSDQID